MKSGQFWIWSKKRCKWNSPLYNGCSGVDLQDFYRLLQKAFKDADIEFAHKNVTLYMPTENADTGSGDTGDKQEMIRQAAAGAALAAEQSDEKGLKKP